jgi:hypothetical protein
MGLALQVCRYLVWFPLAILVITAILRCGVRRHVFLFAYMTVTLLFAVAEMPSSLSVHSAHYSQAQMALHNKLYAIAQGVTHLLIFAVVVSFVLRATQESNIRHVIRTALAVGAPTFIATSFFIHYDGAVAIAYWLTPLARDLSFCAVIVDMILWGLLLSSRKKDQTLLLLTGGMGILFAGDAIRDAIRSIAIHYHSTPIWYSASLISIFADGASLYVWWQAFRREASTGGTGTLSQSSIAGR